MTGILFSLRGRLGRDAFWITLVPLVLVGVLGWLLSSFENTRTAIVGNALGLAVIWPLVAVNVKRWHDRDKSGWWMAVTAIPLLGQIWWLVECGLLAGSSGYNGYGEPPPRFLPERLSSSDGNAGRSMTPIEAAAAAAERLEDNLVSFMKMAGLMIRSETDPESLPKKYDVLREYLRLEIGLEGQMLADALTVARGARFSRDSFDLHADIVKEAHKLKKTDEAGAAVEDAEATDAHAEYQEKYEAQFDWKPSEAAAPTADYDTETLNTMSDLLFNLAIVDEKLSDNEEILLAQLFVAFGFRGAAHSSYRSVHGGWQGSSASHIPLGDQEKYYARKLGLEMPVTPDAVRSAYRRLVKRYHPDKVAHLGGELRKTADTEIKEINEAYSYFSRKHGL